MPAACAHWPIRSSDGSLAIVLLDAPEGSRTVDSRAGGRPDTSSGEREIGTESIPAIGLTRLGNVANGDAPRPRGACRVLMIGDLIGKPGRHAVEQLLPSLRKARGIDFVTANGENVAGGMGLTASLAESILAAGVDVITSGNHIWDKREIYPFLDSNDRVLRPHNYGTHEVPGRGWGVYDALDGSHVAVINLQGRTYMQPIENPFTDADGLLDEASSPEPLPPIRLVDFHCELTSEKNALGLYLDGRVSVVVGTHTHVVTGDERILPGDGVPDRSGDDRAAVECHRVRPGDGIAALHQRAADSVRGRGWGRRFQCLSDRHRSGDGTGFGDRADPTARRGVSRRGVQGTCHRGLPCASALRGFAAGGLRRPKVSGATPPRPLLDHGLHSLELSLPPLARLFLGGCG